MNMPASTRISLAILAVAVTCAVFAPFIAPWGEAQIVGNAYEAASRAHWFGTDQIGRDVLSRLIYGARNTLGLSFLTTLLSFGLGCGPGIFAGIRGGIFDTIASRLVDAIMAIPVLIFALMLLAVFGKSLWALVGILAVLDSARVFRLARTAALPVAAMDFVEAAKLRGERTSWIVWHEILPNIIPLLVVEFGLRFCFVFLTISALSFLGVGIQPPTADWGSMVAESKSLISFGRLQPLVPAAAIALVSISVNFVADWLFQRTSSPRDAQ